jgi:hypothetical protein
LLAQLALTSQFFSPGIFTTRVDFDLNRCTFPKKDAYTFQGGALKKYKEIAEREARAEPQFGARPFGWSRMLFLARIGVENETQALRFYSH